MTNNKDLMNLLESYAPIEYRTFFYDDEPLDRILYGRKDCEGPTSAIDKGSGPAYISALINAMQFGSDPESALVAGLLAECDLSAEQCISAMAAMECKVPQCPFPVSRIGTEDNLLALCLKIRTFATGSRNHSLAERADGSLVRLYEQREQYEEARIIVRQSLAQSIVNKSKEDQGGFLNSIGFQYFAEGCMEDAAQYFADAAAVFQKARNTRRYANARANYWLAMFELGVDYTDQTVREIEEVKGLLKGVGIWQERKPLILLAKIAERKGDVKEAVKLVEEATKTAKDSGTRYPEMDGEYLKRLKGSTVIMQFE